MLATIQLTRFASTDADVPLPRRQCWPLVVTARGIDMPSEIFVYHAMKPTEPIEGDRFECVASVNQLFELPKSRRTVLDDTKGIPYYRVATVELLCRSAEEAEHAWLVLVENVKMLVENFNAAGNLVGVQTLSIGEAGIEPLDPMTPPTRYQISYKPAGTATVTSGVQGITSPDSSKQGWLPVANAPSEWVKPGGAKFFYNINQDPGLKAIWKPKQPFSGQQLHKNGLLLPYGIVYVVTKDTIWWLDFDDANFPELDLAAGENAPWPLTYVDQNTPGDYSPVIAIHLFH